MNVTKRTIEGTFQTTDVGPIAAVVVPMLPLNGGWAVTGSIIAVPDAVPRSNSVVFQLSMAGYSYVLDGTFALFENDDNPPFVKVPTAGWSTVRISPFNIAPSLQIEFFGLASTLIDWGWSLDVVQLSLP